MEFEAIELYDRAKEDKEFQEKLKSAGQEQYIPRFWWSREKMKEYGVVYFGYLIAKGETKN